MLNLAVCLSVFVKVASFVGLLGKTTVSDRHQITVRVKLFLCKYITVSG